MGTHYTEDQDGRWLVDYAILRAAKIEEVFAGNKHVGLIYSGMSGVSRATALAMYCKVLHGRDLGMVYVRKPHEQTYSSRILEVANIYKEADGSEKPWSLIFVDDLISSGETRDRCATALKKNWRATGWNNLPEAPSMTHKLIDSYDAPVSLIHAKRTAKKD